MFRLPQERAKHVYSVIRQQRDNRSPPKRRSLRGVRQARAMCVQDAEKTGSHRSRRIGYRWFQLETLDQWFGPQAKTLIERDRTGSIDTRYTALKTKVRHGCYHA